MRIFAAVLLPEEVAEDLEGFVEPRRQVDGPRWVPPSQWHLTVAFAPSVPERAIEPLLEAVAVATGRLTPTPVSLAGGGCFPDVTRARVLYAGVRRGEGLAPLAASVRTACSVVGAAPDGGPFVPHVTLARFGRPVEATRWLRVLDSYAGPSWTVDELAVVQSHLPRERGRRPRHEVLARLPIGSLPAS